MDTQTYCCTSTYAQNHCAHVFATCPVQLYANTCCIYILTHVCMYVCISIFIAQSTYTVSASTGASQEKSTCPGVSMRFSKQRCPSFCEVTSMEQVCAWSGTVALVEVQHSNINKVQRGVNKRHQLQDSSSYFTRLFLHNSLTFRKTLTDLLQ